MTSLKLHRYSAGKSPKEAVAVLHRVPASDTKMRMDNRLYKKVELGLVDLTVEQAEALATDWGVPIDYIRHPNPTETPKISVATRAKAQAGPGTQVYRMTADLPRELADAEAPLAEKLKVCGYCSLVEWQKHNLRLLNRRYRRKKAAPDAGTVGSGKELKATHSIVREEEKVNV